jgi:hypothetical protein
MFVLLILFSVDAGWNTRTGSHAAALMPWVRFRVGLSDVEVTAFTDARRGSLGNGNFGLNRVPENGRIEPPAQEPCRGDFLVREGI